MIQSYMAFQFSWRLKNFLTVWTFICFTFNSVNLVVEFEIAEVTCCGFLPIISSWDSILFLRLCLYLIWVDKIKVCIFFENNFTWKWFLIHKCALDLAFQLIKKNCKIWFQTFNFSEFNTKSRQSYINKIMLLKEIMG